MTTIAPNQYALENHTPRNGSHFAGTWDQLIKLVEEYWGDKKPGFTDGCWEVTLPPEGFFAGVVDLRNVSPDALNMGALRVTFETRKGTVDEDPMLAVRAPASLKAPALKVKVICYSHGLLGDEASTAADFELVTIVAEPFEEPAPMPPVTMARNFLGLKGGTKGEFSAEDFAKSIIFWAQHAVAGDPE